MSFLKVEENRCVNTDQIADLSYSPAGPPQVVTPGSENAPILPARLSITLSTGDTISVEGDLADGLWEALQQMDPPSAQPDWFLQLFVNMANDTGLSMDITLQVSGFLVSGHLVGGRDYFDGMGEEFARSIPDGEPLKESFAALRDQHYPKVAAENSPKPGPTFIHLKNARFFNTAGNPIPGNRGVWWRGRLSEVSGFLLGGLSPA